MGHFVFPFLYFFDITSKWFFIFFWVLDLSSYAWMEIHIFLIFFNFTWSENVIKINMPWLLDFQCLDIVLMLIFLQRVTPWNLVKLRNAIINGSEIHPGATHYGDKQDTKQLPASRKGRISVSRKLPSSQGLLTQHGKSCDYEFEGKFVCRHLQDGDIVLVNRQVLLDLTWYILFLMHIYTRWSVRISNFLGWHYRIYGNVRWGINYYKLVLNEIMMLICYLCPSEKSVGRNWDGNMGLVWSTHSMYPPHQKILWSHSLPFHQCTADSSAFPQSLIGPRYPLSFLATFSDEVD